VGSSVDVTIARPVDVVYRYLADPLNRPEWQLSLRSVTVLDPGEPRVGMRWAETAVPAVRSQMQITRMEPFRVWAESGSWRGITAELTLHFTAVPEGCRVSAQVSVSGRGGWSLIARTAARLAPRVVRSDLDRAGRILAERAAGQ
jgi:uncharacterized membrane protein